MWVRKAQPVGGISGLRGKEPTMGWGSPVGQPVASDVFCERVRVFCVAARDAGAVLSSFFMVSSSVLGPAVTFTVSASVQNLTTADVVQATGKAPLTQARVSTHAPGGGDARSPQHPDIGRGDGTAGSVGTAGASSPRCGPPGCRWRTRLPLRQRPGPGGQGSGVCGGPGPPCGQNECLLLSASQPGCAVCHGPRRCRREGLTETRGFATALP